MDQEHEYRDEDDSIVVSVKNAMRNWDNIGITSYLEGILHPICGKQWKNEARSFYLNLEYNYNYG